MKKLTYEVCVNLNEILYSIDHEGGFMFKFINMLFLSIVFLILSIVAVISAPFTAYKKTKIQKEKETNAKLTK